MRPHVVGFELFGLATKQQDTHTNDRASAPCSVRPQPSDEFFPWLCEANDEGRASLKHRYLWLVPEQRGACQSRRNARDPQHRRRPDIHAKGADRVKKKAVEAGRAKAGGECVPPLGDDSKGRRAHLQAKLPKAVKDADGAKPMMGCTSTFAVTLGRP